MKKLIISAVIILVAAVAYGEVGFVAMQSIQKLTASTHMAGVARKISGPVSLKSDASCTVYLNLSTTARSKAGTGWPMTANTEYKFDVPSTSTLTFLCATTATVPKSVYLVR